MDNPRYLQPAHTFIEDTRSTLGLNSIVARLRTKEQGSTEAILSGEEGSWRNSLPAMSRALERAERPDLWVALEYNPYQAGNQRADVVLLGTKGDKKAVLVVELKQWSKASWDPVKRRAYDFGAVYKTSRHPYEQANDYARFLTHYTEGFHPSDALVEGAAFLHNAKSANIDSLWTAGTNHAVRTFAGDSEGIEGLTELIRDTFDEESNGEITAIALRDANPEQGPEILDAASVIFRDPEAFPLTEEQREMVYQVQEILRKTEKDENNPSGKALIAIEGKAGSGKTWICLNLLALEAHAGRQSSFATNSTQLRTSLQKSAKKLDKENPLEGMITSAKSYWDLDKHKGSKRLLIVDEAQRISQWTIRTGFANAKHVQEELEANNRTQLKELMLAADVVVLMMGTDQQANAGDYLTSQKAKDFAESGFSDYFKVPFYHLELTEQHRSQGSKAYEEWVKHLVHPDLETLVWHDQDGFTVRVADSPSDLEELTMAHQDDVEYFVATESHPQGEIRTRPVQNRLLAGFAWEWQAWPKPAPTSIDDVPFDIILEDGNWKKRWNLRKSIDGYPNDSNWPFNPDGSEQVGSVFSSQGFEFDNVGVLFGEDFVYSPAEGRMTTDISQSKYKKLTQHAKNDTEKAERIRDQYNVLLTRGMNSVALYSVDPATNHWLKSIVNPDQV